MKIQKMKTNILSFSLLFGLSHAINPRLNQKPLKDVTQDECPPTPPDGAWERPDPEPDPSHPRRKYYTKKIFKNSTAAATGADFTAEDIFNVNVGDNTGLTFICCVYLDGALDCEAEVEPTDTDVAPPNAFFASSFFDLQKGLVTPRPDGPVNPLKFVSAAAGEVAVTEQGTGCGYTDWNFADVVNSAGANAALTKATCGKPPYAEIYNKLLLWSTPAYPDGCSISFAVTNTMFRPASFGVMNLIYSAESFIIIDGRKVPYVWTGSSVLDPQVTDQGFMITYPRTTGDLAPGESYELPFTDSPSVTIGGYNKDKKTCWKSPSKTGSYTGIGFHYKFHTFVLQDWDKSDSEAVKQVPLNYPVLEWEIQAQANFDPSQRSVWSIDKVNTKLIEAPEVVDMKLRFPPSYDGYIQSEEYTLGKYDAESDCYVFRDDF